MTTFVLESTWAEDWDGPGPGESWSDDEAENALTWLSNIGSGAASGAATGAVAGPWGALIGGLVGGGLGAAQTAMQQNQQRPPVPAAPPAARPAPTSAPQPAPAAPSRPAPPPIRTIAVPRPAQTRPTPTTPPAPTAPAGSVSASDVASLVTTLAPLLLALGQQLASEPAAPAPPETWSEWPEDSDPWPAGEDFAPTEPPETPQPLETHVDADAESYVEPEPFPDGLPEAHPVPEAYEYGVETESEAECWPAESEWPEVSA